MSENQVSYTDFSKLDLRTAVVLDAKLHPNADRLYILDIKVGEEQKQIVAGIRLHYAPSELVGKTVIVVNNLEPATIRGIQSNGMVLAVNAGDRIVLLTPDREVPPGAQVR